MVDLFQGLSPWLTVNIDKEEVFKNKNMNTLTTQARHQAINSPGDTVTWYSYKQGNIYKQIPYCVRKTSVTCIISNCDLDL